MIIGLTGATGSGKSLISKQLKDKGAFIIDCDKISHEIIKKGENAYKEIVNHFSHHILDEDKNIIRRKLGDIVFSDKKELKFLNECTHKYINEKVLSEIEYAKKGLYKLIVIDAPLLTEAGLDRKCDKIWVVYADTETRIQRIIKRDGITYEQAKNRILSQKNWVEYKAFADVIIDNSKDLDYVKKQIEVLTKDD